MDWERYSKMLPSKKFVIVISSLIAIVLLIIVGTSYFGSNSRFNRNGNADLATGETVKDAITRDSNNNGIPDWEESLYGLDPKGDGAANKKVIDQKKAAAAIATTDEGTQTLTETDKFSQELLSTILALKQSGGLTEAAITNLAASVGDSVDANHVNATPYALSGLTLASKDSPEIKAKYKKDLKALIAQYDSVPLGTELSIMSDGLENGVASALDQLQPIADAYTSLGAKVMKLTTPPAIAQAALDLANSSATMGATLVQIKNFYSNVLAGMVGVDDYTKANTLSEKATRQLAAYFAN